MAPTRITKLAHLQIPLKDVLKATNNFDKDNKIGRGGLGQVYKGRLRRYGELIKIAALRLYRKDRGDDVEFWTEVTLLSDLNHPNLVSIIGFCDENNEKIIITTYAAKGSLKGYLNNPNLTWTQRLKICVGVARALSYLHHDEGRGYGVIHLNINSSTILLDENWEPKLSGFKVSIKQSLNGMDQVFPSEPIGTIGYVDPVIERTKGVTHKSDIYSFGVVLFEILCGREAFIPNNDNKLLARLAKKYYENQKLHDIIFPGLLVQMSPQSLRKYSKTAYSCLQEERAHRPHMLDIVDELEKASERAVTFQSRIQHFGQMNFDHFKITLDDIKSATHNFSETYKTSSNDYYTWYTTKLGHFDKEDPSSVKVKGKSISKRSNRRNTVVIKRFLAKDDEHEEELFFTELEVLTCVKHRNIVTLIGFCVEDFEMILVIEKISNGFLRDYLDNVKNKPNLTWEKRLKICIDVAHMLNYLHYEMEDQRMIIHNNISTAKLGLDENLRTKIGDFEWAMCLPRIRKDKGLRQRTYFESKYHVDPEYEHTGKPKRESDVYSFGVVMLEILCGRHAHDQIYLTESEKGLVHVARRNLYKGTLEEMIDPAIKEETAKRSYIPNTGANIKNSLHTFINVAIKCVTETQDQRPTMKIILEELKKAFVFLISQSGKDQVVVELEKATHELPEEEVERPYMDGVVHKHKKSLELHKMQEIIGKNMEHLKVPLTDIRSATHNFSKTYEIEIRDGCTLYRAEIHSSKTQNTVLIKRYPSQHHQFGKQQFWTEIKMLSCVKHPNIVTLLGFCVEASEMILVLSDNFSKGFLASYLKNDNEKRILTWERRLKICIDVAHALKYIHSEMENQKRVINRDICSYNIGLDRNWGAKIVDFWWSVFLPQNQEDEAPSHNNRIGRPSYIDPQYEKTGKLKRESDVYGFGVLLFEILCGRLANDSIYLKESDKGLAAVVRKYFSMRTLKEMIDPIIKEETGEQNFILNLGPNKDSLHTFTKIAQQCVEETQEQRPTMDVVVKELEKALQFQKNNTSNPRILLEDIIQATKNFHNDNRIGLGGFGSVYKGKLPDDDDGFKTIVAKRLNTKFGQGEQQFLTELQILLLYKHENVIGLVGYCDEQNEKIIVCEYAPKGSLDKYLSDVSLTWAERLNICIDVANALYFFHGGAGKQARVIHRDIKSANILLYHGWKAKLADFGLSLISPLTDKTDYVIDHACGTPGYLDPLYKETGFLTIESDIYSFGVVLFEMLCGRSTHKIHQQEGHYLANFVKNKFEQGKHDDVVFRKIREHIEPESLTTFQKIAYQCLHHKREERPTTKEILMQLKKALSFQLEHLRIRLSDIKIATNNFSEEYRIALWMDDFSLYRAKLKCLHKKNVSSEKGQTTMVIIKRYPSGHERHGEEVFFTEIEMLTSVKHPNIVTLHGFCFEGSEMILVLENLSNGFLGDYLGHFDQRFLNWERRLKICIDVAHALRYIHSEMDDQKMIINNDICCYNIGLDENFGAKIVDFDMSVFLPPNQEDGALYLKKRIGRLGYIDPEYEKSGKLKRESDVYSFGVLLFEILCWRKAYDPIYKKKSDKGLGYVARRSFRKGTLEDMIYPTKEEMDSRNFILNFGPNKDSLHAFIEIANRCLAETQDQRPTMKAVVKELKKALSFQEKKLEHLKIRPSDIKSATNNFSHTHTIASWGEYTLYRAEFHYFGKENSSSEKGKNEGEHPNRHNLVVIKRYTSGNKWYGDIELFTEIEMFTSVKHPNIATLLGYCVEGSEMILVIENVSNGYLRDYLDNVNDMRILTWEKRLKICTDVARALNYLHYEMEAQKTIIHRDIGSYAIGLDEHWGAKIVDFWTAVFLPPNQEDKALFLNWRGRSFYIDPEYKMTDKLKRESDVYSFGTVLFEILFGKSTNDMEQFEVARQKFRTGTLENMIDPILKFGPNKDSMHTFMKIAYQCVAKTQDERPTMKVVVKELEEALLFQENNKDNARIPLEDIKLATQNFHDDNCIGKEGYGKFYKGNLPDGDGFKTIVAKRLDTSLSQSDQQFFSELQILWEYKHENIIGLVGYCDEHDNKIIVYEYAPKGSLDRYLNDVSLTWVNRLNICIDIASALDFLHGGVGKEAKVHRDIKVLTFYYMMIGKQNLLVLGFRTMRKRMCMAQLDT